MDCSLIFPEKGASYLLRGEVSLQIRNAVIFFPNTTRTFIVKKRCKVSKNR